MTKDGGKLLEKNILYNFRLKLNQTEKFCEIRKKKLKEAVCCF